NVADMFEDPRVANVEVARTLGNRSQLVVPMLQADQVIGTINVYGAEPAPFTDAQVALLETFADQAVIAIENTRLFEEVQARTKELAAALEYQTATSEVLSVISRSPSELQPAFDTIASTAKRLCEAERASIFRLENGSYRLVAVDGVRHVELVEQLARARLIPGRESITGRVALERRVVHVHDMQVDKDLDFMRG